MKLLLRMPQTLHSEYLGYTTTPVPHQAIPFNVNLIPTAAALVGSSNEFSNSNQSR